jgi:hypothetical protein
LVGLKGFLFIGVGWLVAMDSTISYEGRAVHVGGRTFSFDAPVKSAVWADMQNGHNSSAHGKLDTLVVLFCDRRIFCYNVTDGAVLEAALPFDASKLLPLARGVLLCTPARPGRPLSWFVLLHALSHPVAVRWPEDRRENSWDPVMTLTPPTADSIQGSGVVATEANTGRLAFWQLRSASTVRTGVDKSHAVDEVARTSGMGAPRAVHFVDDGSAPPALPGRLSNVSRRSAVSRGSGTPFSLPSASLASIVGGGVARRQSGLSSIVGDDDLSGSFHAEAEEDRRFHMYLQEDAEDAADFVAATEGLANLHAGQAAAAAIGRADTHAQGADHDDTRMSIGSGSTATPQPSLHHQQQPYNPHRHLSPISAALAAGHLPYPRDSLGKHQQELVRRSQAAGRTAASLAAPVSFPPFVMSDDMVGTPLSATSVPSRVAGQRRDRRAAFTPSPPPPELPSDAAAGAVAAGVAAGGGMGWRSTGQPAWFPDVSVSDLIDIAHEEVAGYDDPALEPMLDETVEASMGGMAWADGTGQDRRAMPQVFAELVWEEPASAEMQGGQTPGGARAVVCEGPHESSIVMCILRGGVMRGVVFRLSDYNGGSGRAADAVVATNSWRRAAGDNSFLAVHDVLRMWTPNGPSFLRRATVPSIAVFSCASVTTEDHCGCLSPLLLLVRTEPDCGIRPESETLRGDAYVSGESLLSLRYGRTVQSVSHALDKLVRHEDRISHTGVDWAITCAYRSLQRQKAASPVCVRFGMALQALSSALRGALVAKQSIVSVSLRSGTTAAVVDVRLVAEILSPNAPLGTLFSIVKECDGNRAHVETAHRCPVVSAYAGPGCVSDATIDLLALALLRKLSTMSSSALTASMGDAPFQVCLSEEDVSAKSGDDAPTEPYSSAMETPVRAKLGSLLQAMVFATPASTSVDGGAMASVATSTMKAVVVATADDITTVCTAVQAVLRSLDDSAPNPALRIPSSVGDVEACMCFDVSSDVAHVYVSDNVAESQTPLDPSALGDVERIAASLRLVRGPSHPVHASDKLRSSLVPLCHDMASLANVIRSRIAGVEASSLQDAATELLSSARVCPPRPGLWPADLSPTVGYAVTGRLDLAALHAGVGAGSGISAASLRSHALRAVLAPPPKGVGLGCLTVQGIIGMPLGDVGKAAMAATAIINASVGTPDLAAGAPPGDDSDGLTTLHVVGGGLRFSRDRRLGFVSRLLRASRPRRVYAGGGSEPGGADDASAVKDQAHRVTHAARITTATSFGRAMLTYATAFPSHADPVAVPVVTVACMMMPREVLVRTDVTAVHTTYSGVCDWPEFHNGVAAGLRMAAPLVLHSDAQASVDNLSASAVRGGGDDTGSPAAATRQLRAWVRSHRFSGQSPELAALLKVGDSVNDFA